MKHLFDVFDHLIESLEDAQVDPVVIDMVTDAREALEDSLDELEDEDQFNVKIFRLYYNTDKPSFGVIMSPEEMMLNLVCLDRGIVQLNDISSVQKQFEALSPSERRKVSRKIRKLAKKFIRNTT